MMISPVGSLLVGNKKKKPTPKNVGTVPIDTTLG
jgi:hypothetical protein